MVGLDWFGDIVHVQGPVILIVIMYSNISTVYSGDKCSTVMISVQQKVKFCDVATPRTAGNRWSSAVGGQ